MKAVALFLLVTASASLAAMGQGQFAFNNRVPPEINARFVLSTDPLGTSSVGAGYTVQLFSVANSFATSLDPASTTFGGTAGTASAGYVIPTTETVPGIPPGSAASILLRVIGPESRGQQDFGPYPVMLGGGTITPPNLALGTSPLVLIIPEPSAVILVVLGIGALRWFVRPQKRAERTRGCAGGSRQPTA